MRVPGIIWMPGRIQPNVSSVAASTLDIFPTVLALAGVACPKDVVLDGIDLRPLLVESQLPSPRPLFFYRGDQLFACRWGDWKAHFRTQTGYGPSKVETHEPPLLFHLGRDPGEKRDLAAKHHEVLAQIQDAVKVHQAEMIPGKPQLH